MIKKYLSLLLIFTNIILSAQIVIDQPGQYGVGENTEFTPSVANDAIVLINASDVIFDGRMYLFSQDGGSAGLRGIEISAGVENVRIQNVIIQDVSGTGILVNNGCSNISIENVQINGAGIRGIDFQGTNVSPITDSIIRNCTILNSCTNTTSGDAAIILLECQDSQVRDCTVESSGNTSVNFFGLQFDTCTNCLAEGIKILACSGLDITAFDLDSTIRSSIMASSARNNNASDAFIGINIFGSSNLNNFISECLILRNNATGDITGISLGANSQSNVIRNSTVLGNLGASSLNGIQLTGGIANNFNNSLINCLVQSNQTTVGNGAGISIDGSNFGVIDNCIISFNTAAVFSVGLWFMNGTGGNNWLIRNNQIVRNIGFSDATSFGIREQTGVTNLFFNNVSFNNGANAGNQLFGISAGARTAKNTSNLNNGRGATNWQVIP